METDSLDMIINPEENKIKDKCGIIGIYLNKENNQNSNAAWATYYGLYSLQHRGQKAVGIAIADGKNICHIKGKGLVSDVLTPEQLQDFSGHISVGHVLHSSEKKFLVEEVQPFVTQFKLGGIAVVQNGSLLNYDEIRHTMEEKGATFVSNSNAELIAKMIASNYKKGMERSLADAIQGIKGSFALAVMTKDCLIGARDIKGIRPLCLGKLDGGWILASESCAIDAVNGTFVRDIQPGEIVIISNDGVLSFFFSEVKEKCTCSFEYLYFARPDSVIDGISVHEARLRMGALLAAENPVKADIVIGVPDSGLGAAIGYSKGSGIPYAMGIAKNRYIGRIRSSSIPEDKDKMYFIKLNAIKSDIKGKRVIVVDDSIIGGKTSRHLVQMLRRAGAKEIHMRIASPPIKYPCHFGIDTTGSSELISSLHNATELCKEIGADSLAFISLEGMMESLQDVKRKTFGFCQGCFIGKYPIPVQE
ncbi:MAG: amidophosphoribosyltransferase [Spirochaetaceae bacterium]|nr:amidophosphoribosyltransferase [Spirochaetaceae bacterium]